MRWALPLSLLTLALAACAEEPAAVPEEGEVVEPPFAVAGEAEGLLLVWFDEEGSHVAARRSEIPEARRARVRVDDLSLSADRALDPSLVYVADLSREGPGGGYEVRRMPREAFDALVDAAGAREEPTAVAAAGEDPDADVIVYGASWCGACRQTAAFLRSRNVPFVERDVEREPGAREAMQAAARAAGVTPRGIPVIDFRGEIITGFNQGALERAIERSGATL